MPTPAYSGAFGDLLDPRFQQILWDQYKQAPDMLPMLFDMVGTNQRNNMSYSGVGAFGDFQPFAGQVSYDSLAQAYDTTITPLEFTNGFQVERKLFDDDQYHIMDQRPRGLADAAMRTRQKHGARIFINAFSNDSFFYVNSEALSLCNNAHTTNASGVDTSTGFDNLITSPLTATAVATARVAFVNFRDDRGNIMTWNPDEILIPSSNLYEVAYEIVASMGKVETADNNRNVHEGAYRIIEWQYLTDNNNWFMMDSAQRKQMLKWTDRIPLEFAFVEDFDTFIAKWRAYMRYANGWIDWRWILGAQVS